MTPLRALDLGASPLAIRIVAASRQLLPVTLSIHGGALVDRFGPRRVIVTLGLVGAASTLLFPVLPFLWTAILLQMIVGFAETTNWVGARAAVGQPTRDQPLAG